MNKIVDVFLSRLTYGAADRFEKDTSSNGVVEVLARVYERARNALEYRADHLVRRAAIERIVKRRILLDKNPSSVASHLLTELRWARYLSINEVKRMDKITLEKILDKYISNLNVTVPNDWIVKMASSEIEELFNLNIDYKQFTYFAFQAIRQKIKINDENADLLVFFAVDKVYGGSDDEQISYHILKLAGEITGEKLAETWRLFNLAKNHKILPRITKFVRRQMPPFILLRDMYFAAPSEFKKTLATEVPFRKSAEETLEIQLMQMSGRIKTAGWRSVLYVFLTKMILAVGLEIPFEIFVYGSISKLPLAVNLLFPPLLMWVVTFDMHLPKEKERAALIDRAWFTINNFDELGREDNALTELVEEKNSLGYSIFSLLYIFIFLGIFALIYFVLGRIGFNFANKVIFVFFLTVIAFFAYRISQIAKVYTWKDSRESSTFGDIVALPILTIGSRLSRGLTKLNFLAFTFDFILEAPFKIILGFLDSWFQFLSVKKEEEIIE